MLQKMAQLLMKWAGWQIVGTLPDEKKYIAIAAPHTSNWDVVVCVVSRFAIGTKFYFLAKQQAFVFPLNILLKAIGAVPVDRSKRTNLVDQIAERFKNEEVFRLGIAPEGTRKSVTRWKEGFYHIAVKADVPIVMVGMDYSTKSVRIAEAFKPTGDIKADFTKIFAFFKTIHGCYPKAIPDEYTSKE